jgi:hypothetical protein|tara:strand:- start:205 stop:363 length:159 start_codon:yes stop_codon:yes gene_type:complete
MEKGVDMDKIVCKLYNEFHEQNQDLFMKDRVEYWHKADIYKKNELRKINYKK